MQRVSNVRTKPDSHRMETVADLIPRATAHVVHGFQRNMRGRELGFET